MLFIPLPKFVAFKASSGVQLKQAVQSFLQHFPNGFCARRDVTSTASSISSALQRKWHALSVPPHELRLDITLTNGQCFGWKRYDPLAEKTKQGPKDRVVQKVPAAVPMGGEGYFYGVIGADVFLLKQTPSDTYYQVLNDFDSQNEEEIQRATSVLRDYFQLKTNLKGLYSTWESNSSNRFASILLALPGMRIVRQDPAECLFSFICSSNNNIRRIILMLDRLREKYGVKLWVDHKLGIQCYSFPSIARLAEATEEELRALGFGYRAPWIRGAAVTLHQMSAASSSHASGREFLFSLRSLGYEAVRDALTRFKGVGMKVADCVALFSLDQVDSIPVDTHVWQIACRDLDPSLKSAKSLTPAIYKRVGNLFRDTFGQHAGWAHSVLFAAELPAFASRLPANIVADMRQKQKDEKAKSSTGVST